MIKTQKTQPHLILSTAWQPLVEFSVRLWREWEGVEPTYPVLTRHNGFEIRKSHRAPSTPSARDAPMF